MTPSESTPYQLCRQFSHAWSVTDLRAADLLEIRYADKALRALHARAGDTGRLPGRVLLAQFERELSRRALSAAAARPPAGPYSQALKSVLATSYAAR